MCLFLIMQFKHILFAFINGLKSPRDGPKKCPKRPHQSEFFSITISVEHGKAGLNLFGPDTGGRFCIIILYFSPCGLLQNMFFTALP